MNKHQKITLGGFTLIEILVVISVIGILAGAISFVLNPIEQFKKARDAERKHDLGLFKVPLQEYEVDNNRYPISTPDDELPGDFLSYMQIQPEDPINTQNYAYQTNSSGSYYRLYAKLERCSNDPQTIPGVNCSSDPYNYCVSSPNIACALFAPPPTPTPTPTPTLTPTPTDIPPVIGCDDGSTEKNFGTLPSGKRIHGCNGSVNYTNLDSLCASGWHVGDVGPAGDSGLGNFLANNPAENNITRRTLYVGGSGTSRQGYRNIVSGVEECWGTQLAPCTISDFRTDLMLTHTEDLLGGQSPTYFNGLLVMPNNGIGAVNIFVVGAICVEGAPPPTPTPTPTPPAVWVLCPDGRHIGQTAATSGVTCQSVCSSFGFPACSYRAQQNSYNACVPASPLQSGLCSDVFQLAWSSQCRCQ